MHVLKVIKPIVITQRQLCCGYIIRSGSACLDTAFCALCVRQGQIAGSARGGVMPKLTKITTVTAKKTANVSLDSEKLPASFSTEECTEIRRGLLEWYDEHHRVLPWRRNFHSKRPGEEGGLSGAPQDLPLDEFMYYVMVCEVMSQQTQLPRVVEYFNRWIGKWPTIQALSEASLEEVNAMWAGLGYYRRARFLLEGAQYVMQHHGGSFPRTSKELQKIPGIGAYTGNAIASIACQERVAAVDANVVRVLARLRRLAGDPKLAVKEHAALADALLDPDRPGDFNQAVMELGAKVCTVHQPPDCAQCPVKGHCQAHAEVEEHQAAGGDPADAPSVMAFPGKVEKAKRSEQAVAACVLELRTVDTGAEPQLLLVQRPEKGLLAGLWEFPGVAVPAEASERDRRKHMDDLLLRLLGASFSEGEVLQRQSLGNIIHIFSHIRMTLLVERLVLKVEDMPAQRGPDKEAGVPGIRWVSPKQLQGEGLSSSVCKVAKLASKGGAHGKQGIKRFFAAVAT